MSNLNDALTAAQRATNDALLWERAFRHGEPAPLPYEFITLFYNDRRGGGYANHTWALPLVSYPNLPVGGKVLHVAITGSDSGTGSLSSPYLTPKKALDAVVAGDVVYLHTGTYLLGDTLSLNTSGTIDKPIVMAGFPGEVVKLKFTDAAVAKNGSVTNAGHSIITISGNFVWLQDVLVEGYAGHPSAAIQDNFGANCVSIPAGRGLGVKLINVWMSKALHCGFKALSETAFGFELERCIGYDNGNDKNDHNFYVPASGVKMHRCGAFGCIGAGFHFHPHTMNLLLDFSVIADNGEWGIVAASENGLYDHLTILHNGSSGDGVMLYGVSARNNNFTNCIIWGNTPNCYKDTTHGQPALNKGDYNCVGGTIPIEFGFTHTLTSDPLVNPDGTLKAGSPVIHYAPDGSDLGALPYRLVN